MSELAPTPAPLFRPPRRGRPRLGPTLAVLFAALPLHLGLSAVLVALALALRHGADVPEGEEAVMAALGEVLATPSGLLLLMLPVQLVYLGLTCCAAAASPTPFRRRLGLVRWQVPTDLIVALVLATPLLQLAGGVLTYLLDLEQSAQLEMIEELLTSFEGSGFVLMLAFVTLGAGFSEELLFRGYIQTRLAQRWPAPLAVLVPGVVFAALHLDPTHAVAVFPLGLWFGFLALLSGSVWPAIAAHVLNNALGVWVANALAGSEDLVELGLGYLAVMVLATACGGWGLFRLAVLRARA